MCHIKGCMVGRPLWLSADITDTSRHYFDKGQMKIDAFFEILRHFTEDRQIPIQLQGGIADSMSFCAPLASNLHRT